jgi:hypothetical protein
MTGLREYATPCPADHTSSHGRARTTRRPYPGVLVSWRYERDRRIKRAFVRGPRRPAGGYRCAWCGIVEPPEAASEWTRPPRAIIARTRLLRSSIIEQFSPMSEGRRDPRRSHFRRESLRGGDRRPFYRAQMRVHHLVQADRREALSKVSKPTVDRLVGKMIRLPLAGRGHRRAWCGDRGTAEGGDNAALAWSECEPIFSSKPIVAKLFSKASKPTVDRLVGKASGVPAMAAIERRRSLLACS